MSQESLAYGLPFELARSSRLVLASLNDAVEVVTLDAAVAVCKARKADLHDALSGRENRYIRGDWERAIVSIAPAEIRNRYAVAHLAPIGLAPAPIRPLTDRERADRLEARIRALGTIGQQMLDEALGPHR